MFISEWVAAVQHFFRGYFIEFVGYSPLHIFFSGMFDCRESQVLGKQTWIDLTERKQGCLVLWQWFCATTYTPGGLNGVTFRQFVNSFACRRQL